MTDTEELHSLAGNFLLAVPGMADPFFAQTLTLICEHNSAGAMGVVINQPTQIQMLEVFQQLEFDCATDQTNSRFIGYGGPVGRDQGFILHTTDTGKWTSSLTVIEGVSLTASADIIEAIANGSGPEKWLFVLGYAGWSAGQLDEELAGDSWLVTPAGADLIFDTPAIDQARLAAQRLGINIDRMGMSSGRA